MILSCVRRIRDTLGYTLGVNLIGNVLRGSKNKKLLELKLDSLSTYGLMKDRGRTEIHSMISHLEALGYLRADTEFQTLDLTAAAGDVLYRGKTVTMKVEKEPEQSAAPAAKPLAGEQADLLDALKDLRFQLAKEAGVPAYVVFTNATLTDMAKKKPKTMSEFKRVSGVGELKAAWYGKQFLELLKNYGEGQL